MDEQPKTHGYINNILNQLSEERRKQKGDDFFYHYTNLKAFQEIIKGKEIHFSNCKYLNDKSEIEYGKDLIKEIIEKKKTNSISKKQINCLNKLLDVIHYFDKNVPSYSPGIYIFCLCENGDLLSQWRGYSGVGCSVAIKFELKNNLYYKTFFSKVIYERKRQREIFEKIIKDFLDECETCDPTDSVKKFSFELVFGLPFFKDEKFREEEEWRFIFINMPKADFIEPINFRYKETYLLPYVKFSFKDLFPNISIPIKEIVVGPTRNTLSRMSIIEFMDTQYPMSLDNKEILIIPSKIPSRTF